MLDSTARTNAQGKCNITLVFLIKDTAHKKTIVNKLANLQEALHLPHKGNVRYRYCVSQISVQLCNKNYEIHRVNVFN